jgi:hypothetical protein
MFIESNEVAERYGKACVFVFAEWVNSEGVFKPRHDNGEAKGIKAGIEKREAVSERRKALVVLLGDLSELSDDFRTSVHDSAYLLPST